MTLILYSVKGEKKHSISAFTAVTVIACRDVFDMHSKCTVGIRIVGGVGTYTFPCD